MVKNVVKTRTSEKHKWSPKIGRSNRMAVAAASRKWAEKKRNLVSPKAADRNMWSGRTETAWSSHVVESL